MIVNVNGKDIEVTEVTIEQEMIADNDTLVITDPCYLLKDEDWEELGNTYGYDNLKQYLSEKHNFGELVCGDTGFGDWSNMIIEDDTDDVIGRFTADAGMFIVCTASDLTNYGVDKEKFDRYVRNGLIAVIPDYSGRVTVSRNKEDNAYIEFIGATIHDKNYHTLD